MDSCPALVRRLAASSWRPPSAASAVTAVSRGPQAPRAGLVHNRGAVSEALTLPLAGRRLLTGDTPAPATRLVLPRRGAGAAAAAPPVPRTEREDLP